jgi:hypothetical protein
MLWYSFAVRAVRGARLSKILCLSLPTPQANSIRPEQLGRAVAVLHAEAQGGTGSLCQPLINQLNFSGAPGGASGICRSWIFVVYIYLEYDHLCDISYIFRYIPGI